MKRNLDIVGKKKIFFAISSLIVVFTVVFALIFGVKMDIQCTGGSIITYSFDGELDESAFAKELSAALDAQLKTQLSENTVTKKDNIIATLGAKKNVKADKVEAALQTLQEKFPDNNIQQESINSVSASMGSEFFIKCIAAVAVGAILMILYIAFRFRKIGGWSAGVMSVVALMHDVFVIFAVFVLCRIPLNDSFIAVVLTILGYSINATIVIYDRIRENSRIHRSMSVAERVNLSINQTMTRTVNTTITTVTAMVIVCIIALIYGVDSIFTFAFPMIIGMISGLYSSVCISGPLWVTWQEHKAKKKAAEKLAPKAKKK